MLIYEIKSGEKIYRRENTIIVYFPGKRRLVSTSLLNGGLRDDLQAVFNHRIPFSGCKAEELPGGSVQRYMQHLTQKIGLPIAKTSGLLTAAKMENASIESALYREMEVTAVVTAGVEINGGRAGDPASYYELDGRWSFVGGTINILLFIDGNLPYHTLVRAVVTAAEAKACALQELMAPSRYSAGIATGSGTDGIIVVSNAQSKYNFCDAGKHAKLGELIGVAVKEAVKSALAKETGLSAQSQRNFLRRWERYGVTVEDFWHRAVEYGFAGKKEAYVSYLHEIAADECLTALSAALLHLLDEYAWGLLPDKAVVDMSAQIIKSFDQETAVNFPPASELENYIAMLFIQLVNRKMAESIIRF